MGMSYIKEHPKNRSGNHTSIPCNDVGSIFCFESVSNYRQLFVVDVVV